MSFGRLTAPDLQVLDDWLALAQILAAHDPDTLERLGFYQPDQHVILAHLAVELGEISDPELGPVAARLLGRIRELSPVHGGFAGTTLRKLEKKPADERWWVPHDIDAPPTTEPVARERVGFTRADVSRVLADL
jgi:hypothetical protein